MFGDRMVAVALAFAVIELGGSATDVGLVLTARAVPLIACLLIGGVVADRTSRRSVLVIADLVRLGSQGFLAPRAGRRTTTTQTVAPIAVGCFAAGLGLMLGNTLWETTVQRHVPRESLSRVSSYDWFGSLALDPIGLAIWGPTAPPPVS